MAKLKVSSVEGNRQMLDGGAMFGNAPRAMWEKWIQPDERGRIPLACRCLLLEVDDKKILCETGIGCFFEPKLAERFGVQEPETHKLLENLKTLGVSESDVDYVILSHLHFDHAGGLLASYQESQKSGSRLLFPKAQYVVGRKAYERGKNPHPRDRASFIPGLVELLESSGRLILIDGDEIPGSFENTIRFFRSDGHTPGQMHTIVSGEKDSIVYAGDLIPGRAWVNLPITMGYDRYAEKVIDEKSSLYEQVLKENWILFFTHDHEVSAARVEKNEKGKFVAGESFTRFEHQEI